MIKSYSINNNFTSKQEMTLMIISHIASFDWLRHNGPRLVTYSTSEMVKSASSKTHDVMKNITI